MKYSIDFVRRRWLDFRNGHTTYLVFALAFTQYIVLMYTLAITKVPILKDLFPSIWYWMGFFVIVYLPSAIIVGHYHMKKQIPTEARMSVANNPFTFYATIGKESMFGYPSAVLDLDNQLKSMNQWNQLADFIYEVYNRPIEKWTTENFVRVQWKKQVIESMLKGESIESVVKRYPCPP